MDQYQFPFEEQVASVHDLDTNSICANSMTQDLFSTISNSQQITSEQSATRSEIFPYTVGSIHPKFGSYNPMAWTTETILQLLHTTNDGRYILADYKKNDGFLSDESQNLLTKLLINHLFQDKSKKKLYKMFLIGCFRGTDFFFRKISELIVTIFPKEQKSIYFIPAKTEGHQQTHAKGKLIERWKNVARRLRTVGAIQLERYNKNLPEIVTSSSSIIISEEAEIAKKWLKNEGLNAEINLVKQKWILTYDIRKKEIFESQERHLSDIFQSWPILQGPKGYDLIIEDFKLSFPDTHNLYVQWSDFLNAWDIFFKSLVDIRQSSIKDKYAQTLLMVLNDGDSRTCNIVKILLIPYLIPTKTQIKNTNSTAKSKFWKPSLVESACAFATHVTNMTQFQEELTKRQHRYSQNGSSIQPFITFVGEDIQSVHTCYVRVNQKFWHFECPLKALEVCFKSYFVFHCAYPKECYDSWLMVQMHLFKLNTEYDRHTSITTNITAKIQSSYV